MLCNSLSLVVAHAFENSLIIIYYLYLQQSQQEKPTVPASTAPPEEDTIPEESGEELEDDAEEEVTDPSANDPKNDESNTAPVATEVEDDDEDEEEEDEAILVRRDYVQVVAQKQRPSVPHSSDGESGDERSSAGSSSEEDDAVEEEGDVDGEGYSESTASDDLIHIVSFMPRRHSLPVSSLHPPASADPSSHTPSTVHTTPFSLLAQRRHSLPVSAIPNAGLDIFEQLSDQLESVAECSFNDQSEHTGDKISLSSLNPGALPDAKLEANKLTSAHGLDGRSRSRSQPLTSSHFPLSLSTVAASAATVESPLNNTTDIAQAPSPSSSSTTTAAAALHQQKQLLLQQQQRNVLSGGPLSLHHRQKLRLAPLTVAAQRSSSPSDNKDCSTSSKTHGPTLSTQQHSVVIGRERAVSIPTHYRLKNALLDLESSFASSRRVSMGDQPIYLDTTPLLSSPVSGMHDINR